MSSDATPLRLEVGLEDLVGGARIDIVGAGEHPALGAAAVVAHQIVDGGDRLLVRRGAGVEDVALGFLALVLHGVEEEVVEFLEHRQHGLARHRGPAAEDGGALILRDQLARLLGEQRPVRGGIDHHGLERPAEHAALGVLLGDQHHHHVLQRRLADRHRAGERMQDADLDRLRRAQRRRDQARGRDRTRAAQKKPPIDGAQEGICHGCSSPDRSCVKRGYSDSKQERCRLRRAAAARAKDIKGCDCRSHRGRIERHRARRSKAHRLSAEHLKMPNFSAVVFANPRSLQGHGARSMRPASASPPSQPRPSCPPRWPKQPVRQTEPGCGRGGRPRLPAGGRPARPAGRAIEGGGTDRGLRAPGTGRSRRDHRRPAQGLTPGLRIGFLIAVHYRDGSRVHAATARPLS